MRRRPYYEEMGWSSEWYYHRYRIGCGLSDAELLRIVELHGDKAREEIFALASVSERFAETVRRLNLRGRSSADVQTPTLQRDLFEVFA